MSVVQEIIVVRIQVPYSGTKGEEEAFISHPKLYIDNTEHLDLGVIN